MNYNIAIKPETLTDNSIVYNVSLSDGEQTLKFSAVDKEAADKLADTLASVIADCTVDTVTRKD